MSYSFDRRDTDVQAGLRRIALDQIDKALEESEDADLPLAERIHQVRKRCKKLRGLIRLVRPAFAGYQDENAAFREAARRLSDVRDAAALVETCDRIRGHFSDQLDEEAFAGIRRALAREAEAREAAEDVAGRLDRTRTDLGAARDRAARWELSETGAEALTGGLKKTYARARREMKHAAEAPTGARLHAWRKRVKYHWYHLRLLHSVEPTLAAQAKPADALAGLLGDHHDLVVMDAALEDLAEAADPRAIEAFRGLMGVRRRRLESRAFREGRRVLAERPKALCGRAAAYWRVWREKISAEGE